jgi:DNA-binding SARP family transcriptional activator
MEPIYVDVRTSTVAGQLSRVPAVMSHAGPERIAGSAPTLRVYVLGELRVEIPDGDRDRAWLDQRPGQLLRYLVCQRARFAPADEIVEALWPRSDVRADENVRYLVHQLRRRLEPDRPPRGESSSIECRRGAYALSDSVVVDAYRFEGLVSDGAAGCANGDDEVALAWIDEALALYRGDFLADEPYADWAIFERDRLRGLLETALKAAAGVSERAGDLERASSYVRRLAELVRYDSDVQLWLLSLCLKCGRRTEALRRYDAFRARLIRDFGEEPEFDLADAMPALARGAASASWAGAGEGVDLARLRSSVA